jgi:hypothetical protein
LMLEKIALPTPCFSEAPITAIDRGERKISFESLDDDI